MKESIDATLQPADRARSFEPVTQSSAACALVVLGMHRSGTSAVTRVLNLLGADLPDDLLPPDSSENAPGFWESREVVQTNDELLGSVGSSWDDLLPLPESLLKTWKESRYQDRLLGILDRQFRTSRFFVLKDPRICRLVPLWLAALESFGAECRFIIPLRNPLEVAGSLEVRDGFSLSKSQLLWLRHVVEAELHTRDHKRAFVSYHDLLQDWRVVVEDLAHELNLDRSPPSRERSAEIDGFLSDRHRHHHFSRSELEANSGVLEWVKRAFAAAEGAREDPQNLAETFDDLGRRLGEANQAFVPLLAEIGAAKADALAVRSAEIRSRDELAERDRALAESRLANERLITELDAAAREKKRLDDSAAKLRTDLARARTSAERSAEELRKVQGHLTTILSGRLMRTTRPFRRVWHRLRGTFRT